MDFHMVPTGVHGGLGSPFLFNLLEGGTVPEHFAESRTVFNPRHLTSMTMEGSLDHQTHFVL